MAHKIWTGDNLVVMEGFDRGSFAFIYADPPFNSDRNYNHADSNSKAHEKAFDDMWSWDQGAMAAFANFTDNADKGTTAEVLANYLKFLLKSVGGCSDIAYATAMAPRLLLMYDLLTPNGTLALHCDASANWLLKPMLVLIFGRNNILSEIIWQRNFSHNNAQREAPVHDTIYICVKDRKNYIWNPQVHEVDANADRANYGEQDKDGTPYKTENLTGKGRTGGSSGQPWVVEFPDGTKVCYDPSTVGKGRHWAIPGQGTVTIEEYERRMGVKFASGQITTSQERLDLLQKADLIVHKPGEMPRYKIHYRPEKGRPLKDVWTDIPPLGSDSDEVVDFDTQKPLALITRLIEAHSNRGDHICDPFLGSGTTAVAAENTGRTCWGIELTPASAEIARRRIIRDGGTVEIVSGWPADMDAAIELAKLDPKGKFQDWVCYCLGGRSNPKRSGDGGIDGFLGLHGFSDLKARRGVIQIKSGGVGREDVATFITDYTNSKAILGVFVTMYRRDVTPAMRQVVLEHFGDWGHLDDKEGEPRPRKFTTGYEWSKQYDRIQFVAVEEFFEGPLPPRSLEIPPIAKETDLLETKRVEARRGREAMLTVLSTTLGESEDEEYEERMRQQKNAIIEREREKQRDEYFERIKTLTEYEAIMALYKKLSPEVQALVGKPQRPKKQSDAKEA